MGGAEIRNLVLTKQVEQKKNGNQKHQRTTVHSAATEEKDQKQYALINQKLGESICRTEKGFGGEKREVRITKVNR